MFNTSVSHLINFQWGQFSAACGDDMTGFYTNYGGHDYKGFYFDPNIKISKKEIVIAPQVIVYPNEYRNSLNQQN
jgi:hypothetical protein